jgi:hypothetical protein
MRCLKEMHIVLPVSKSIQALDTQCVSCRATSTIFFHHNPAMYLSATLLHEVGNGFPFHGDAPTNCHYLIPSSQDKYYDGPEGTAT